MQQYGERTIEQILYRLMGLRMAANVLHTGAHPDDEDVGLIAYLTFKFGVRAAYWSATRGEGGQNRISNDKNDALGVIRTWESVSAGSIHHGECLFGPFYDFGYAKNVEEAFRHWGWENLVRELVRAIRLFQPHIVVSRWSGTSKDVHGHHQAIGQATIEAFKVAGDPKQFPELAAYGLAAWKPLKLYISMDNSRGVFTAGAPLNMFGEKNEALERDEVLRINTAEYDPNIHMTYQEKAWLAYNEHRSQGMRITQKQENFFYYFALHFSHVPTQKKESHFFDGFDNSITGLAHQFGVDLEVLQKKLSQIKIILDEAITTYRADNDIEVAESLMKAELILDEALVELSNLNLSPTIFNALHIYLSRKRSEFKEVIAYCLGLQLECVTRDGLVMPGQQIQVYATLWNRRNYVIKNVNFISHFPDNWMVQRLDEHQHQSDSLEEETQQNTKTVFKAEFDLTIPEAADLSLLYWLRAHRDSDLYIWPKEKYVGTALGEASASIKCEIEVNGKNQIKLEAPVIYKKTTAVGVIETPLRVVPPISLYPQIKKVTLLHHEKEHVLDLEIVVQNLFNQLVEGRVEVEVPKGWKVNPAITAFSPTIEDIKIKNTIAVPSSAAHGEYFVNYKCFYGDRDYGYIATPVIIEDHGLETILLDSARVSIQLVTAEFVKDMRYGYIQGTAEDLLSVLQSIGLNIYPITDKDLTAGKSMTEFSAVIIGENAYETRAELSKNSLQLLDYVEKGGTLIVQYQRYEYEGQGFTPYPFRFNVPHDRVAMPDVPVKILDPKHPLFHIPNSITSKDFEGWIHDRGLYFWGQWDKMYTPLLASADPGEELKEGGLCVCYFGKGTFVYTGYSFFRQLPAGVQGAIRLFANILALPYSVILERMEFLQKNPLFSKIPADERMLLAKLITFRKVAAGSYISYQGEEGRSFYLVRAGEIEILKHGADGKDLLVRIAKPGEVIGESSVLGNVARAYSFRAKGEASLFVIDAHDFSSLIEEHPNLAIRILTSLHFQVIKALAQKFDIEMTSI